VKNTAIKVAINHLPHIGSEKAILLGKVLIIYLLKRFKVQGPSVVRDSPEKTQKPAKRLGGKL